MPIDGFFFVSIPQFVSLNHLCPQVLNQLLQVIQLLLDSPNIIKSITVINSLSIIIVNIKGSTFTEKPNLVTMPMPLVYITNVAVSSECPEKNKMLSLQIMN